MIFGRPNIISKDCVRLELPQLLPTEQTDIDEQNVAKAVSVAYFRATMFVIMSTKLRSPTDPLSDFCTPSPTML